MKAERYGVYVQNLNSFRPMESIGVSCPKSGGTILGRGPGLILTVAPDSKLKLDRADIGLSTSVTLDPLRSRARLFEVSVAGGVGFVEAVGAAVGEGVDNVDWLLVGDVERSLVCSPCSACSASSGSSSTSAFRTQLNFT